MKPPRVVGIGCIGRSRSFSEILDKILENYSLGPVNAAGTVKQERPGVDEVPVSQSVGGFESSGERVTDLWTRTSRITGFCVSLMDNGPSLSVFPRRSGKKPDRCSWSLASSMELRKSRLN